ncbi:MAG: DegV family EDD domain-containing protein [Lachnospiraceae bacterium]|nr:DegV family EDD domain-containing protein [Lachnospiraceae bacterium]
MRIKKIRDYLANASYDIQDRLFILLSLIAMISMICAIVGGMAIGENWQGLVFTFVGLLTFALIVYLAYRFDRLRLAEVIIAMLTTFVVMPMVFFTSGGIYGGTPIWFMLSILYIGMILRGRARAILLVCQILVISACYYCEYFHIIEVIPHTEDMVFLDSFTTLIIVSCMMLLLVSFQTYLYRLENKRSEERREEIDAMSKAQSRFFSNMSHEIRTPVNTIIGLNEMILREDTTREVAEDAAIIQSSSRMLLNLINDILDMSKLQSGKMDINPVVYNIGNMLSEIVNMIWGRAKEKGLEFNIDVDPEVPARLVGDEVRIEQILLNILTNAVKYTNSGSVSFFIGTKITEKQDVTMVYRVTDTGMGIRKESMPYLFSAFRRIDEQQTRLIEGTGLGLSITKELLDLMGGEIRVNSIYTEGSTFTVEIPQGFVDDEKVGALDLQSYQGNAQKRLLGQSFEAPDVKVLVVDDNSTNLMVVKKLLRDTGIRVDTVQSGVQALQMTLGTEYHLIFMDHLMPGMDGITCMHRIREQAGGLCRDAKIVALTANAGTENQNLYMREGFDGYLLKPVSGYQLEEEIIRQLPGGLIRFNGAEASGRSDSMKAHRVRRFPILITTDSVCDLPEEEISKNDIAIIPYHVYINEGDFYDGTETHSRGVLAFMEEKGARIRSESPSKEEYEQFFAGQLKNAINIIHISMSAAISEGYKRALAASETFDNVTVIDCGSISSGLGMHVMKARDLAREGKSVEQIRDELVKSRENICAGFIVEDPSHLEETGSFPAFFTRLSQIFYLHPVLEIKGGRIRVRRVYLGNRERVIKNHVQRMLRNSPTSRVNTGCLFITHTGLDSEELTQIKALVEKKMTFDRIIIQRAGAAVTTELGPGCFGLIFEMG